MPHRSFGYRLWMLRHAWTRRLEAALDRTGLTHMQFFLLRAVAVGSSGDDKPSQARLAEALQIDRMTVSTVLRTLEAKGLVRRDVHPQDPRANAVVLTHEGEALEQEGARLALAEQERFFGRLGPERKAAFSGMLDDLLDHEGVRLMRAREHA